MVLINILTKLKKLILKEHQCQHSKKKDGTDISYQDYYKKQYNVTIKHEN